MNEQVEIALVMMDDNKIYLTVKHGEIWRSIPDSSESPLLRAWVLWPVGPTSPPDVEPEKT